MNLSILSPEKEIFEGQIISLKVPGVGGEFMVLKNHAAIVSALGKGKIFVEKTDGEKMNFEITRGFVEVLNNKVSLLVQGVS